LAKVYRIEILAAATKQLRAIPHADAKRIAQRIDALAHTPRPDGVTKLSGNLAAYWRLRVGQYRIIYEIRDDTLIVTVVTVGNRRDVYR
jgi:mRNA interferase RelE/StbE